MAELISRPILARQIEEGRWIIAEELRWEMDDGYIITVPAGFETDFSSVPRLVRAWVPKDRSENAGACHDLLYRTGELPRARADRYWREIAMAGFGDKALSPVSANLGYAGIRVGGWVSWRRYRRGIDARV